MTLLSFLHISPANASRNSDAGTQLISAQTVLECDREPSANKSLAIRVFVSKFVDGIHTPPANASRNSDAGRRLISAS
jgi:hypothetical protein